MVVRHFALCALLIPFLAVGCASSKGQTAGGGNLATPPDLAPAPDLVPLPPDLTPPADLTVGPDLATPPDLVPPPKAAGQSCALDSECASRMCRPFGLGGPVQCLAPCQTQADCALFLSSTFCEPAAAGQTSGFCIPNSPLHCASCTVDANCGLLAERCLQGPGDTAAACHIDCSLAGALACPPDYQCATVPDGTAMRKLCLPTAPAQCLDSLGGYCDRTSLPQNCGRTNNAGTCNGQRACLVDGKRYDKCGAMTPQYKTCSQMDPAGCMENYTPGGANDKNNCGMCGKQCAGGQDCCSGSCQALGTLANCGACGNLCGNGQGCCGSTCTSLNTVTNCGACGTTCVGGQGCCGGACTALNTNANCGACGNACAAGQTCCGSTCVSLTTLANCGTCGNACAAGQACCNSGCVNLNTVANCGSCGNVCGAGQGCCNGTCTPLGTVANCGTCGNACATGSDCCGSTCTPLNTVAHCGGCNTVCGAGQGCCGNTCTTLNTVTNCGACGTACAGGQGCCGNTCAPLTTNANCGSCGNACVGNTGCCGGSCTDLTTNANCGACGNACPASLGNNDFSCTNPAGKQCSMTCRGENYDVNNNTADGCERLHQTPPGHDQASALDVGNSSCYSSTGSFTKNLLSDSRVHQNPTVLNFSGTVGSAPDYFKTYNTGGFACANSYSITFTTSGGGNTVCYKCSFITDKKTDSTTINGNGSGSMSGGSGSWSDNNTLYFKIEKTCSTAVQEAVTYGVSYKFGPF